ncbi:MAG: hypothetical protein RR747_10920, partial [Gordonibacter sp.]
RKTLPTICTNFGNECRQAVICPSPSSDLCQERAAVLLRRGGPQGAGKRNSWLDRAELQQLVVMATHQLVNQRRIPFEVVPAMETPNEETRRALVAAEAKELGLIPDDSAYFNDIDELMAFLDE